MLLVYPGTQEHPREKQHSSCLICRRCAGTELQDAHQYERLVRCKQ